MQNTLQQSFLADDKPAADSVKRLHLTLFRQGAIDTVYDKVTGHSFYVKMGFEGDEYEMSVSSRTRSNGIVLSSCGGDKCKVPKMHEYKGDPFTKDPVIIPQKHFMANGEFEEFRFQC